MKLELGMFKLETDGELANNSADAYLKLLPGRKVVSIARAKLKTERIFTECMNEIIAEGNDKGWSNELIAWRIQSAANEFGKQMNLEEVVTRSVPILNEGREFDETTVDAIDSEWMHALVDHAENTRDEDMRDILAAILAGEVNKPGSYSKATVATLSRMDAEQVRLFEQICNFIIFPAYSEGGSIKPVINNPTLVLNKDTDRKSYADGLVAYSNLMELEAFGLVNNNAQRNYAIKKGLASTFLVANKCAAFISSDDDKNLGFPVVFTRTGSELSNLFSNRNVDAIRTQLAERSGKEGFRIEWVDL